MSRARRASDPLYDASLKRRRRAMLRGRCVALMRQAASRVVAPRGFTRGRARDRRSDRGRWLRWLRAPDLPDRTAAAARASHTSRCRLRAASAPRPTVLRIDAQCGSYSFRTSSRFVVIEKLTRSVVAAIVRADGPDRAGSAGRASARRTRAGGDSITASRIRGIMLLLALPPADKDRPAASSRCV